MITIRTEEFAPTVTVVNHTIVNDVIHIEGIPFNEYFATRELTAELLRGLGALTNTMKKMRPSVMHNVEFNVDEKLYPVFDAIYKGAL
ncbi:hypothetical protein D3C85_128070 [compost metagenome]